MVSIKMVISQSVTDEFVLVAKQNYRTYFDGYELAGMIFRVNNYNLVAYFREDLHTLDLVPL